MQRFQSAGLAQTAESWIGSGANLPISPQMIHEVMGSEIMQQLAARTGLPLDQLADQLAEHLPTVVDGLTPNGQTNLSVLISCQPGRRCCGAGSGSADRRTGRCRAPVIEGRRPVQWKLPGEAARDRPLLSRHGSIEFNAAGVGSMMKILFAAAMMSVMASAAWAEGPSCTAQSTDKHLSGAAKTSFMKRCSTDAQTACDATAADKHLAGAAKTSFTKNASRTAWAKAGGCSERAL